MGIWESVYMSASQSLVLDSERGELVKACSKAGKRGEESEAKTVAALKSHSETERRRRERINAHLDTLRGLVPSNGKMDKAALLAEVINHVKQLQKTANHVSDELFIPLDSDRVQVEQLNTASGKETSYKASLCCDYRPGLLPDLRKALNALQLSLGRSEVSTLEGRVMVAFFFTANKSKEISSAEDHEQLVKSVQQALSSIMEKYILSSDYLPRIMLPNKRQRVSYLESSSSSS